MAKARESGMPEEEAWDQFFDPRLVVERLVLAQGPKKLVLDLGCGYGTFCLPLAARLNCKILAIELEAELVYLVAAKAKALGLIDFEVRQRDFCQQGTGLGPQSVDHAMIYNLLHLEQPVLLLQEIHRILTLDGFLSVLHWRSDIPTPRGPSLSIRPTPQQCISWAKQAGFSLVKDVDLQPKCPFHFGLIFCPEKT